MSLRNVPSLIAKFEEQHGDEAELPEWLQYAAAMYAVSDTLGLYTSADDRVIRNLRQPPPEEPEDPFESIDHAERFANIVELTRLMMTSRGGLLLISGETIYDPVEIANHLSERESAITPSHVRAVQR